MIDEGMIAHPSINNLQEGDILCQMFGICPMKMSFIDNLSINDVSINIIVILINLDLNILG